MIKPWADSFVLTIRLDNKQVKNNRAFNSLGVQFFLYAYFFLCNFKKNRLESLEILKNDYNDDLIDDDKFTVCKEFWL